MFKTNLWRIGIFVLGLCIGGGMYCQVHAQKNDASIEGFVRDDKTGLPLVTASVYLSHTLLGSSTSEDGFFEISAIPDGEYTLVVSMIGYESIQEELRITSESEQLERSFGLTPMVYELDTIGVIAEQPRKWQRQFDTFSRLFLGTMPYEEEAQILNPYSLDFQQNSQKLTAFSDKLLVIVNAGLGYRIYFQLMGFEWDRQTKILLYTGSGYFELMEPQNEAQEALWKKNRGSRGGNYSWLSKSNPSSEGAWKGRVINSRCGCDPVNFGFEGIGVCRCTYRYID